MKKIFLFCALVLVGSTLDGRVLWAQTIESPFDPHLQYSADVVITTEAGLKMHELYSDNGKVRLETNATGNSVARLLRPDLQKFYFLVMKQKAVVELPYAPDEFRNEILVVAGAHGQFQEVGPDRMEGVNCIKYKGTAGADRKAYLVWVDAATKAPVKIMAEDGTFSMVWRNYKSGPQAASLFEPPADFKPMAPTTASGKAPGTGK